MMEITTKNGYKLEIDDSLEAKDKAFKILTDWIMKYDADSWEMMGQDEDCQICAIDCLGEIVDEIVKKHRPED